MLHLHAHHPLLPTGCSSLLRSDSDSTLSTDTMESSSTQMPKCGPNTNAKAAAVAKAKAAATADKAAAAAASADKSDKASIRSSMLSRSSNNSSPATVNGKFAAGLQSLGGLGSSISSSMLSMLSQGMLGLTTSGIGSQDWGLGSMLGSSLGSSGRLPSLPMEYAADAGVASHSADGIGPLCDTFGTLDLAAAAASASGSGLANSWSSSPAAVNDPSLNAAALAAVSLGLPSPQLGLAGDLSSLAGQYNTASSNLALAAAAQQVANQQQQQQQMQDVMTAVLLRQHQLQQQQHRQAMWTAAFTAASNVGLDGASAAACADAAVQNTTAAAGNLGMQGNQVVSASGNLGFAGLQNSQLAMLQQQQQLGVHGMLGGGGMSGFDSFAGQVSGYLQ